MFFKIGEKRYYLEDESDINCIMLYGSWARHENDIYSDMDILIVTESTVTKKYEIIDLEGNLLPQKWITIYSKESIERMKMYTSLFLWHIKIEAAYLYKRDSFMDEILNNLLEYNGTVEDIYQYKVICQDIKELMQKEQFTSVFYELSLLGSLVRNISIAYCYLNGKKSFGRNEPVAALLKAYPLFSMEEYKELYQFRLIYNNSIDKNYGQVECLFVWKWIYIIEKMIKIMEDEYV